MKGNSTKISLGERLKSDITASIVVYLVALPLCLGISVASLPGEMSTQFPLAGIIAGIVGGIVVGLISKSSLGVSGPAAGLISIILGILEKYPFQYFLLVVICAGIFQVIFGVIKAGVIADYFPTNVIKGMLAAIGIILILKQIPHGLGYDKDAEGNFSFIQIDGGNTFTTPIKAILNPSIGAVIITLLCMGILIIWQTDFFKKNRFTKLIPAPLLVVIVGAFINQMYHFINPNWILDGNHLVRLPTFNTISEFTGSLVSPDFNAFATFDLEKWQIFFKLSFTIALVASLESLLSVEATDKLDPLKRVTPTDRELIAQGAGNIVSGMIGGLPITQVIVRSSANVNSGGKTQASTILHGIWLLLSILIIPSIINTIPLASLAAILLMIGYKLANLGLFKQMYQLKSRQFIPFIVTIIAILLSDLLIGITIGLIISIFFILQNNRNNEPFDVSIKKINENGKKFLAQFRLKEEVNYLSKHILMISFHDIPANAIIKVDLSECTFISHDVLDAIDDFKNSVAPRKNIDFQIIKRQLGDRAIDTEIIKGLGSVSNLA